MNNLPSIHDARLPDAYRSARRALEQCARIDECKDWADKAEALASYAKQSKDDTLRKYASRIQARAIRRCGELLKQLDGRSENAKKQTVGAHRLFSRAYAAERSGLSEHQAKTAVRVANIPSEEFETAVESENPPTVTALAEQGKHARPVVRVDLLDLGGRDPEEFAISTDGQGRLHELARFAERVDAGVVARGSMPKERQSIRRDIEIIDGWLDRLIVQLED